MAGATLAQCKLYGRWSSDASLGLYVDGVGGTAGSTMRGMAAKVIQGVQDPSLLLREPPRPREAQIYRAKKRLQAAMGPSGRGVEFEHERV